jgi:MFS family permease
MNDVGCLSAGFLSRLLHQKGFKVHASRCIVFGLCAALAATGGFLPWLPSGPWLFTVLMLVAMGSLGLFPCYYSFSQELSNRHKGTVLGLLGTIAWLTSSPLHPIVGEWADRTKSYDLGIAVGCGLPVLSLIVLVLFWPEKKVEPQYNPAASLA